jgi:hypothetical protein
MYEVGVIKDFVVVAYPIQCAVVFYVVVVVLSSSRSKTELDKVDYDDRIVAGSSMIMKYEVYELLLFFVFRFHFLVLLI